MSYSGLRPIQNGLSATSGGWVTPGFLTLLLFVYVSSVKDKSKPWRHNISDSGNPSAKLVHKPQATRINL